MVAADVVVEISPQHGKGFEEGAALVVDVQNSAFATAKEKYFKVVEANHDERLVNVSAVGEHGG